MCLQADIEHVAAKLEESLNLTDEEKEAEVMKEETAAPPAASTPEAAAAEEAPHAPDADASSVDEHEEPEEEEPDSGDSRQHLNVVFIGHVGRNLVAASSFPVLGIYQSAL